MAYSKLPTLVQDAVLTFQAVNQWKDNAEALHDQLEAFHGDADMEMGRGSSLVGPFGQFGIHDDFRIPRAVCRVSTTLIEFGGVTTYRTQFKAVSGNGVLSQPQRLGLGLYLFWMSHLDESLNIDEFTAIATPQGASLTAPRTCQCRTYGSAGTLNGVTLGPIVYVQLFEVSAGTLELSDFEFCLEVYG